MQNLGSFSKILNFSDLLWVVFLSHKNIHWHKYKANEYSRVNVYHYIGRYQCVENKNSGTYTKEVGCL